VPRKAGRVVVTSDLCVRGDGRWCWWHDEHHCRGVRGGERDRLQGRCPWLRSWPIESLTECVGSFASDGYRQRRGALGIDVKSNHLEYDRCACREHQQTRLLRAHHPFPGGLCLARTAPTCPLR
ncbi:unnamed protein product, partial [Hapterophycus canaliculatus]